MEIYNEEINDLLAPENRKLQIHENLEVVFDLWKFMLTIHTFGINLDSCVLIR